MNKYELILSVTNRFDWKFYKHVDVRFIKRSTNHKYMHYEISLEDKDATILKLKLQPGAILRKIP